MKKIYLMLFGAMLFVTANAQNGADGYVLDSTYTTDLSGARWSKTVNEYNDKKQLVVSYDYSYLNGVEQLSEKTLTIYDDNGKLAKQESYDYVNGEPTLVYVEEAQEYNGDGEITVITTKGIDDENPAAGLQNGAKLVAVEFDGKRVAKYDYYVWEGNDWELIGYYKFLRNADGTLKQEIISWESFYEGLGTFDVWMVTTFEYDNHKNVTKETEETSIPMYEYVLSSSETNYKNEYDAAGNPIKITSSKVSEEGISSDIEHLFWSTSGTTSVDLLAKVRKLSKGIYDYNGLKLQSLPTKKGLYIVDGKKVMIK